MDETKTSVLNSFNCILQNWAKDVRYCRVCFHIWSQRRLVESKAYRTLMVMLKLNYKIDDNFFLCYICQRNAMKALHFCQAVIKANDVECHLERLQGSRERFGELLQELHKGENMNLRTEMFKCERQLRAIRNCYKLTQSEINVVNYDKEEPKCQLQLGSCKIAIKPSPPKIICKSRPTPCKIVMTTNRVGVDTTQMIPFNYSPISVMNDKLKPKPIIIPAKNIKTKTTVKRIGSFAVPSSNTVSTQVIIHNPASVQNSMPVIDPLTVVKTLPIVYSKPSEPLPVSDQAPVNASEILLPPIVKDAKGSIDVPSMPAKIVYRDPKNPLIVVMKKFEIPIAPIKENNTNTVPLTPDKVAGGIKKPENSAKKEMAFANTKLPVNVVEKGNCPSKIIINESKMENDIEEWIVIKEEIKEETDEDIMSIDEAQNFDDMPIDSIDEDEVGNDREVYVKLEETDWTVKTAEF